MVFNINSVHLEAMKGKTLLLFPTSSCILAHIDMVAASHQCFQLVILWVFDYRYCQETALPKYYL